MDSGPGGHCSPPSVRGRGHAPRLARPSATVCLCPQLSHHVPSVWFVVSWSISVCLSICLMSVPRLLWEERSGHLLLPSSVCVCVSVGLSVLGLLGGFHPEIRFLPSDSRRPGPNPVCDLPAPSLPFSQVSCLQRVTHTARVSLPDRAKVRDRALVSTWWVCPKAFWTPWGDPRLGSKTSQAPSCPPLSLGSHLLSQAPAKSASSGVSPKDATPLLRGQGQGVWCVSTGPATEAPHLPSLHLASVVTQVSGV